MDEKLCPECNNAKIMFYCKVHSAKICSDCVQNHKISPCNSVSFEDNSEYYEDEIEKSPIKEIEKRRANMLIQLSELSKEVEARSEIIDSSDSLSEELLKKIIKLKIDIDEKTFIVEDHYFTTTKGIYSFQEEFVENDLNYNENNFINFFSCIAKLENNILIIGGLDLSGILSNYIYEYQTQRNKLVLKGKLSEPRACAAALHCNDHLFVIGGRSQDPKKLLDSIEVISTHKFNPKKTLSMEFARENVSACELFDKIYIVSPNVENVIDVIDTSSISCKSINVSVLRLRSMCFIASFKKQIIILSNEKFVVCNSELKFLKNLDLRVSPGWSQYEISSSNDEIYYVDYYDTSDQKKLKTIKI